MAAVPIIYDPIRSLLKHDISSRMLVNLYIVLWLKIDHQAFWHFDLCFASFDHSEQFVRNVKCTKGNFGTWLRKEKGGGAMAEVLHLNCCAFNKKILLWGI